MRERIQVNGRRFYMKAGITFVGVWESRSLREWAYLSFKDAPLILFVIPRPDSIDRKQIRALILQKMGATKECER